MQIPRLFVDPSCLNCDARNASISDKNQINQLTNVLRLRPGDRVDLLDGKGMIYRCRIEDGGKNRMRCDLIIDQFEEAGGEPSVKITVALPLIKSGRFEWALEKLTEIGVSKIIPLETERSVVKIRDDKGAGQDSAKLSRWQSIVREAAEQCERGLIPDVVSAQSFTDLIKHFRQSEMPMLLCGERRGGKQLADLLANNLIISTTPSLVVLVGPEGGFTENEFTEAENAGAMVVSLGSRILRSETAALSALTLLISHLDK